MGYQGGSLSRTTVSLDGFAEAVDKEIPCDPKLPRLEAALNLVDVLVPSKELYGEALLLAPILFT